MPSPYPPSQSPNTRYRDSGWVDFQNFLAAAPKYLSFVDARRIVRSKKLQGIKEWLAWCKAGRRPSNIPAYPGRVYRDGGWVSIPDWLGGRRRTAFLSFVAARRIVRSKKLGGWKEYRAWCKAGRPSNIPSNPEKVYRGGGWLSLPDWLGYSGRTRRVDWGEKEGDAEALHGMEGLSAAEQGRRAAQVS